MRMHRVISLQQPLHSAHPSASVGGQARAPDSAAQIGPPHAASPVPPVHTCRIKNAHSQSPLVIAYLAPVCLIPQSSRTAQVYTFELPSCARNVSHRKVEVERRFGVSVRIGGTQASTNVVELRSLCATSMSQMEHEALLSSLDSLSLQT